MQARLHFEDLPENVQVPVVCQPFRLYHSVSPAYIQTPEHFDVPGRLFCV
jgi:hypothetical protein